MAAQNFERSLAITLRYEGGVSDHPSDPGGLTKQGVTQATYDAWRKTQGLSSRSVRDITDDEIRKIYRTGYWNKVAGDDLPLGIDFAVFDYAVNSGPSRAAEALQRLVGADQDGLIGIKTLAATADLIERIGEEDLIRQYCDDRMRFLTGLSTWPVFGKGWTRRVMGEKTGFQTGDIGVVDYAINMARSDNDLPLPDEPVPGKAWPQDIDPDALRAELSAMADGLNSIVLRLTA